MTARSMVAASIIIAGTLSGTGVAGADAVDVHHGMPLAMQRFVDVNHDQSDKRAVKGLIRLGPQIIEQCHYDNVVGQWVYDDGSLCRGTGEDPTVDSQGKPACADGRLPVLEPSGRVMCVATSLGWTHRQGQKP